MPFFLSCVTFACLLAGQPHAAVAFAFATIAALAFAGTGPVYRYGENP